MTACLMCPSCATFRALADRSARAAVDAGALGEPDGSKSARIAKLGELMIAGGLKAPVRPKIRDDMWVKLWGNLSFNPISALTHATLEDICLFPPTRALAAGMMREAQAMSATIELDLAWEFAPEDEFGFADLAREYFSAQATLTEQTAALFRLYEAPHYFRRAGKGRFKKASAEVIAQALAGIEKKKQIQALIESWAAELGEGICPAPIQTQLYKILFRPDKNAPEYKAVVEASRASQTAPLTLLQNAGAIAVRAHHFPIAVHAPALAVAQIIATHQQRAFGVTCAPFRLASRRQVRASPRAAG